MVLYYSIIIRPTINGLDPASYPSLACDPGPDSSLDPDSSSKPGHDHGSDPGPRSSLDSGCGNDPGSDRGPTLDLVSVLVLVLTLATLTSCPPQLGFFGDVTASHGCSA